MLEVRKEQKGTVLELRLSGSIDEHTDFEALLGPLSGELHVYCKEVPRINSTGVKHWIKYFQGLVDRGAVLKFFECSPALVQQINLIMNFTAGGAVESIVVPFSCVDCSSELLGAFKIADLKQQNLQIPDQKCIKCGGVAQFDDLVNEYFGFLLRKEGAPSAPGASLLSRKKTK